MTRTLGVAIMAITAFDTAGAGAAAKTADARMLSRPLIVGASVSANYGTASPGRRLALRYTTTEMIRTIARGGTPGSETLLEVTDLELRDRSVIIAMDALFWDSAGVKPDASLRAFERFVERAEARSVPLVIGDIPELLTGRQTQRSVLNAKIREVCATYVRCRVLELDELHRQVLRDGYLVIRGRRYTIRELVPDGLHLSEAASEFIADRILKTLHGLS